MYFNSKDGCAIRFTIDRDSVDKSMYRIDLAVYDNAHTAFYETTNFGIEASHLPDDFKIYIRKIISNIAFM